MEQFTELQKKLHITFNNPALLMQAFVHRSYLNEHRHTDIAHNERLEFLGDAVLELVVTEFLYKQFPDSPEGELTSYRSALVNTQSLAETSVVLGFDAYLLLSKGEAKDQGRARQNILANTFESFVGALYLDQDYAAAQKFISECLFDKLAGIIKSQSHKDAKSLVQEKSQEVYRVTPTYKVTSETGPDHDKAFVVAIHFGAKMAGEGKGKSKQEAEQEAAKSALKAEGWA